MNRKITAAVLSALIIGFTLYGCSAKAPDPVTIDVANIQGNTPFNIAGEGRVALQGNWLYYYQQGSIFNGGAGLYCSLTDGTNSRKIASGDIEDINALGDQVYYVKVKSGDKTGTLYSVSSDGTGETKLLNGCRDAYNDGNSIYYIGSDSHLYSFDEGGVQSTELASGNVLDYTMIGATLYWRQDDGFYSMDAGGTAPQKLLDSAVNAFCVVDGKLYTSSYDSAKNTSTITTKDLTTGTGSTFSFGSNVTRLMFYKDKIFLYTAGNVLVRVNLDGTNPVPYDSGHPAQMYFFDDSAYAWVANKAPMLLDQSSVDFSAADVTVASDAIAMPTFAVLVDSTGALASLTDDYGLENADGSGAALTDQYNDEYFAKKSLILVIAKVQADSMVSVEKLEYSSIKTAASPDLALDVTVDTALGTGDATDVCIGQLVEVAKADVRYTDKMAVIVDNTTYESTGNTGDDSTGDTGDDSGDQPSEGSDDAPVG